MPILNSKRTHRLAGILLLAPLLVWALSGIFFLVRPGFQQAYEQIPIRTYAMPSGVTLAPEPSWQEIRYVSSILGNHLLVRANQQWQHLDADTLADWPLPDAAALQLLLVDAISSNAERYGSIVETIENRATTDTGIEITVDWNRLAIAQYGRDTRWIDRIYSLHYLEWTGFDATNRVFGVAGILLLLYMTYSGWQMAFVRKSS